MSRASIVAAMIRRAQAVPAAARLSRQKLTPRLAKSP